MEIDEKLLQRVDELIKPTLKYYDVEHPRLLILFSGPPSSGKSTVAKAIERKFKAMRLENDSIRKIAAELFPDSELKWKSQLAYAYSEHLRNDLAKNCPNGLWINDATIDEHYQFLFDFAEKNNFQLLVLAMDIPEDLRKQWIVETGDRPWAGADKYLSSMAYRKQQQVDFLKQYTPDMLLKPDYNIEDVHALVKKTLDSLR